MKARVNRFQKVSASSYYALRNKYPRAFCIRPERGFYVGLIEVK